MKGTLHIAPGEGDAAERLSQQRGKGGDQSENGGDNCTVKLDFENEPQPDALLFILPEFRGQSRIDQDGYIIGAPEWMGEVAASSVSYDLGSKRNVYRLLG